MPTDRSAVIAALQAIVPAEFLLTRTEDLRPYECDGLSAYRRLPLLVVLPGSVTQVQQILAACRRLQVPVIARGAGTGLSGGALPREDAVLLSLARFNRILDLDPLARQATVEPGVRNLAISEAAAEHGLYYARTPRPRSPAASAATSRKTPAACTA